MKLIDPSDPLYFSQTSDKPYDRHTYQLVSPDKKTRNFDSWEQVQSVWFDQIRNWSGYTVRVLDRKKGF